jgi:hypothetical protein
MSGPGGTRPTPGTLPLRQAPRQRRAPVSPAAGVRQQDPAGRSRPRPRLTGRGSMLVMVVVFLVGNLIAVSTQLPWLGGLGYAAGCGLTVAYARREAMLLVVSTPPLIFLIALVSAELITAGNATALATAEGTILTLAAVAPWLYGCTAAVLVIGTVRGLPSCIRNLRAELSGRGDAAPDQP